MDIDAKEIDFEDPASYHDRVLLVGEKKFYVVSGVLSLWSDHFRAMFDGKFAEANKKEIELKEVDPEVFEVFLRLMYGITNEREIPVGLLIPLIDMSFRFMSPRVLGCCEAFININIGKLGTLDEEKLLLKTCEYNIESLKNTFIYFFKEEADLSVFHYIDILDIALEYNLEELKEHIIQYCSEIVTVKNCSELLDFSVTKNLLSLKDVILKTISGWYDEENERPNVSDRNNVNHEKNVIGLIECAFKHDVPILKTILRYRIFFMQKRSGFMNNIERSRGVPYQFIGINTFIEENQAEIVALPKELLDFILSSTISPVV